MATHLNVCRQIARFGILVSSGEVHIKRTSWGIECVEWVHTSDFTRICLHSPGRLTGFDVAPNHGIHISAIIHEASIKIRGLVWVWRKNVGESSRERIL